MTKVLIVTSADFGELASALYFLDSTPVSARLLLPPRLHGPNAGSLGYPAAAYRTPVELFAAIDAFRPDVLLLFSAYLFGMNGLLSLDDLARLVARPGPIATTDPFLGLLTRPIADDLFSAAHPRHREITAHFRSLAKLLADTTHLYLSDPGPVNAPALAFYNPALVVSQARRAEFPATLAAGGIDASRPVWLFTLSQEDHLAQCAAHSRAAFDGWLLALLQQAIARGRRPVLLAPQIVRDGLAASLPAGATLLPFCSHGLFQALSLSAEHAFYWNVFSNSVLPRVANGGSVFFYDTGHLARAMPAIVPVALGIYYANAELPMLDQRVPVTPEVLAARAADQPVLFAPALERFRSHPAPSTVLARLLEKDGC